MNKKEIQNRITIMQAYLDDKKIQVQDKFSKEKDKWHYTPYPIFDWDNLNYRIAPTEVSKIMCLVKNDSTDEYEIVTEGMYHIYRNNYTLIESKKLHLRCNMASITDNAIKRLKEQIEVMEAYKAGKPIEFRQRGNPVWTLADWKPSWDWSNYSYRVAKKVEESTKTLFLLKSQLDGLVITVIRDGDCKKFDDKPDEQWMVLDRKVITLRGEV